MMPARANRSVALVLGVIVTAFFATGLKAGEFMAEQYRSNLKQSTCQTTERLADFLVESQVPGQTGWAWVKGKDQVAPNMNGLVSLALMEAYQVTGKLTYLRAAQRHADDLLARPPQGMPFKPDVELMVRMYGIYQDAAYRDAARDLFERIRARSPDGADEIARIAKGRQAHPALLGYDAALAIRAALAVDERQYAFQLADEVVRRTGSWYRPKDDPRFTLVSAAALVGVLEALDEAHFRPTLSKLRAGLAEAQSNSGAWLANETQPTAHAILALMYSPVSEERQAARQGIAWLRSTLLSDGGLASYNDGMPEPFVGQVFTGVNAEALTAMAAACAMEQKQQP